MTVPALPPYVYPGRPPTTKPPIGVPPAKPTKPAKDKRGSDDDDDDDDREKPGKGKDDDDDD